MSEYEIRALNASTWDAFAQLAEKLEGMGFGGCWCNCVMRTTVAPVKVSRRARSG